jgi:hypothetical protein
VGGDRDKTEEQGQEETHGEGSRGIRHGLQDYNVCAPATSVNQWRSHDILIRIPGSFSSI